MAKAGRITGSNLVATFAGGTISGDYTSFSVNEEGDMVDLMAGSEQFHYSLMASKNISIDYEAFFNAGTGATGGSAERALLDPGDTGTLIIMPAGTATNYPKWTCTSAIVASRRNDYPFNDGARMRVTFNCNADWTESANA